MVALGAGAALAGLVTLVPQLIWLSEHKGWVFGTAGALLAVAGVSLWNARRLPCPTEPTLARTCKRLRTWSAVIYAVAVVAFVTGATFAFVVPAFAK